MIVTANLPRACCVAIIALSLDSQTALALPTLQAGPKPIPTEVQCAGAAVQVSFIINVHDWVSGTTAPSTTTTGGQRVSPSAQTVAKLIGLHEKYSVPLDLYLDDQMMQLYEASQTALLATIKGSSLVSVNHHLRPPYPYYSGSEGWKDWSRTPLASLNASELYDKIYEYETRQISLTRGTPAPLVRGTTKGATPSATAGGYQHLKDYFGYAPVVVSPSSPGSPDFQATVFKVYQDLGAKFAVSHAVGSIPVCSTSDGTMAGMRLRPEDVTLKVYEEMRNYSGRGRGVAGEAPARGRQDRGGRWEGHP